jgi:hypothetical protein
VTTIYEGREDEHDLGGGHSFSWLTDDEGQPPVGMGPVTTHTSSARSERILTAARRSVAK